MPLASHFLVPVVLRWKLSCCWILIISTVRLQWVGWSDKETELTKIQRYKGKNHVQKTASILWFKHKANEGV